MCPYSQTYVQHPPEIVAVVDWWSLLREIIDNIRIKIKWGPEKMVVVGRWLIFGGGH